MLAVLMMSAASQQSFAQTNDYDADDDNLIEVRSLEQLNAIRYDLDGDGTPTSSNMSNYADAFPTPATSMGCPATCTGYELMADLDFDTSGDDEITTADGVLSWGSGLGWEPIGTSTNRFTAEFHGNDHTISHLFINRPGTDLVGLFGDVGSGAVIRSVGLVGVDVTGEDDVGGLGGLVGVNRGTIRASYATGEVNGGGRFSSVGGLVGWSNGTIEASYATGEVNGSDGSVGGLVGWSSGTIRASYATGEVNGSGSSVGGLVGVNFGTIRASYATGEVNNGSGSINSGVGGLVGFNDGTIRASYATGEVNGGGSNDGGLVGFNDGAVIDSYFDTDTSGLTGSEGRATGELQLPTTYTGIYVNWNVDLDDADSDSNALTGGDDPWHFGASEQYPVLQVDFNGDGVKSWQEFGPQSQSRPGVAVSPRVLSLMEGEAGTYTVVLLTTPTDSVTVTPMSDNPAVSVSGELTFSVQDWNVEQTVAVRAVNDDNVVDEVVSLTHTVESEDLNYALVTTPVVTVNVADHGTDYDADDDNLIEVRSLEQLNAIRYDLDGDGTPTSSNMSNYADAFPYPATSMGCLAICKGYELMADLDFDTSGDDEITAADGVLSWGSGLGWEPIGTNSNNFTAEFHGNGHTISHLFINRPGTVFVGLFGYVGSGAVIRSVGLVGVDVTGDDVVGGLVGSNSGGTINASYATGEVRGNFNVGGLVGGNRGSIEVSYATGEVRGEDQIGGLVGANDGTIRASYATGEVRGNTWIGGLVGINDGTIDASYATGEVRGNFNVGGLVGFNGGVVIDSYFDTDTSGLTGSEGRATGELQSPTTYTGIYANWNVDLDDADSDSNALTGGDDPWHFGASEQYPVLQVDFNGDGVKSWQEFGPQSPQSRPGVFVSPRVLSLMEGEAGTYTVVLLTTPTNSVTVTPMSDNPAVSVSGELTFSMQDWNVEQTVAVRAVNDDNNVNEVVSLTHTVESEDPNYALVTIPVVTVNVADSDPRIDYDTDNDNLIEVDSLAKLNAIRYDLDGDGDVTPSNMSNYADAFPYPATSMGCLAICKGYELMTDLDFDTSGDDEITMADGVLSWGSGSGWQPIGTNSNRFTAEFHGNDHTISHLFINRPSTDYVGLFGAIGSGEVISVGLVGVNVTGDNNVGGLVGLNRGTGLVGLNSGTIRASSATGEVSGTDNVGGLVGFNSFGTIRASSATGVVRGDDLVGGLVGFNSFGTIHASYANGGVGGTDNVGGLVGGNNGTIRASYANVAVSGNGDQIGGLVGSNEGSIHASYATGRVSGNGDRIGGLVGWNRVGTIRASYATGEVSGTGNVGGLVGWNNGGNILASYATGEVSGNGDQIGGLVGSNIGGFIRASYATGEVNGGSSSRNVGGLVGWSNGTIRASYATGEVSGNGDQIGGLVGVNNGGTIRASYATGEVRGNFIVGGLVGWSNGTIRASYATGEVNGGSRNGSSNVGGLVGWNSSGTILASYATGEVNGGGRNVGGLVGSNNGRVGSNSGGTIRASYATGEVNGGSPRRWVRGLVGLNGTVIIFFGVRIDDPERGVVIDSYFDTDTSGLTGSEGRATGELQSPTIYTGIYANWNVDLDDADSDSNALTGGDDPWHFGASDQYPALQVDFDGDGVKSWQEFGPQSRPGVFVSPRVLSLIEGEAGTYMVVLLTMPTNSVTVTPMSDNPAVRVSGELTFSVQDWNVEQTVAVRAVNDDNNVNEVVSLTHTVESEDLNYASVTIPVVTVNVADSRIDYDTDNDNLIEVRSLEQLNAIRYDLDGDGDVTQSNMSNYADAFPYPATSMGCLATCKGYELMADLDFDTSGDDEITTADGVLSWGSGLGWEPIGTDANRFTAEFHGNGHTISHLFINRPGTDDVGLFGYVGNGAVIRSVGLVGVDVTGNRRVGGLVGWNSYGTIRASYATGEVRGDGTVGGLVGFNRGIIRASYATGEVNGSHSRVGGLVGSNEGTINASYATGEVSGQNSVGGLVGSNSGLSGTIEASYATGEVSGGSSSSRIGGLVGENFDTIRASYATGEVSGEDFIGGLVGLNVRTIDASYATGEVRGDERIGGLVGSNSIGTIRASYATGRVRGRSGVGGLVGSYRGPVIDSYFDTNTSGRTGSGGRATDELRSPTTYTGIYANWNVDLDDADSDSNALTGGDDPWHFGASEQYPVLQVDFNGDGVKSWQEFGPQSQSRPGVAVSPGVLSLMEGEAGTYTVVLLTTPTNSVTVTPMSDNPAVSVSGELTFLMQDWNVEQTVAVRAVNDDNDVDEVVSLTHTVESEDPNYASATAPVVTVNVADPGTDYDADNDNLIEVRSLEQLNAIRYDLDGDGTPTQSNMSNYADAFPYPATSMGCLATCKGYELMADLDFDTSGDDEITAADGVLSWGSGSGWQPIGTNTNRFTAEFHGNGHTISHLFINRPGADYVGLFGYVGSGAVIRSVGLVGVDVTGDDSVGGLVGDNFAGTIRASYATGVVNGGSSSRNVGGLVGRNFGTIRASYATGEVNGSHSRVGGLVGENNGGSIRASYATGEVNGTDDVGGLVGWNNGGTINASYATGEVNGTDDVGGLVGWNNGGTINASYATGEVRGNTRIGGLVGSNSGGTIDASYATGEVSSGSSVGGLVGSNGGTINASYATGEVRGTDNVGSLVGWNFGTIRASYATSEVRGDDVVGGLVGRNNGTIEVSYATGEVNGTDNVGGLVGENNGTIRASYATGEVSGTDNVGGLVGENNGTIRASYAIGEVNGGGISSNVGGLVGSNTRGIIDSYFDTDTSGLTGSEGRATDELQSPTTYTGIYANWNVDLDDADSALDALTGGDDPWHFGASDQYPALQVDFDGDGVKSWQEFGPQSRPGVFVSPGVLSLIEGEAGTYTVVLLTTPTDSVTVTPMSDNPAVSVSGELTFSMQDWNAEQTVAVRAVNDDNDADEVASLTHTVESEDPNYASVTTPVVTVNVAENDIDYDTDNDNLIEVRSLEQLHAIRYDLDGDGDGDVTQSNMSNYADAFPYPATSMGCLATCKGYELMADLDFDTSGDDEITAADGVLSWGSGSGWQPIGTNSNRFTAEFHGNDHTISHLFINRPGTDFVGLFGYVGSGAVIRSVGLVGVDVTGNRRVGGLVGRSSGTIRASYATGVVNGGGSNVGGLVGGSSGTIRASYATGVVSGYRNVGGLVGGSSGTIRASYATGVVNGGGGIFSDVGGLVGSNGGTIRASYATGEVNGGGNVGGLVGSNGGTIRASYATGEVSGTGNVGGLVGWNSSGGTIRASYATGVVNGGGIFSAVGGLVGSNGGTIRASYATGVVNGGGNVGGLVGSNTGMVIDSYFDTDTSGLTGSEGRATDELQSPTIYTGIYANWNVDLDDADSDSNALTGGDDPWHFGASYQYPALQVDFNGDGVKSWQEFGPHSRRVAVSPGVLSLMEGEAGTYTVVLLITPTDSVTVTPMSDNPAVSVSGELTFSMQDWNVEQTVAVRAVNDDNDVDEVVSLTHTVESEDPNYASVTTPVVTVNVADPDIDYDADNDNLIEVRSLEQLNAIRYDLDGDGTPTQSNMSNYADAFPYPATSMGCLATCKGYELMADLDFDTSGDDEITTADGVLSWGNGSGWQPIGTSVNRSLTAEFHGNGHTISHLFINRPGTDYVGLFGYVGSGAVIRNVGLVGVDVTGDDDVGGLVGWNSSGGTIRASYATGEVSGTGNVGGLVGWNSSGGTIRASYATGEVSGTGNVGGLVGWNSSGGTIRASYATGVVNGGGSNVGGLVGGSSGTIRASYATGEVNGGGSNVGGLVGFNGGVVIDSYFDTDTSGLTSTEGKTTGELQLPTTYTGIYANWNVDLDDADSDSNALTGGDDPWHFGASEQYPVLQVNFDGDGVKSWQEFGPQSRPGVFVSPGVLSLMEGEAGTYTVVLLTTPTNSVTVTPMSDNPAVSVSQEVSVSGELIFSMQDWNVEQTVAVRAVNDDNNVDEVVSLTHTVESEDPNYASVTTPVVTVNVADPDIDYDTDNDNLIEVRSLEQLNAIRYDLDGDGDVTQSNMSNYADAFPYPATSMGCLATCKGYELMADLDFDTSGDDEITAADGVLSWGSGLGWEPIGTNTNNFTAEFHGNGHTISHLFINRPGTDFVGLFGDVGDGAVIRSVGLVGVDVTGENSVGGLVGWSSGTIRASYATGVVRGDDYVGGLVGINSNGTIRASYATGEVSGAGNVGGLVGFNGGTGTIRASYATGVVNGGGSNVGGLVGGSSGTIRASYATGEVSGQNRVGGLVGSNNRGFIRASYATGEVRGNIWIGGLVGWNNGGTINASYATGGVGGGSDGSSVGGLVGRNIGGTIIDSYFDTDTSGLTGSEGRATGELQLPTTYTGIYANWNVDLDDADSDSNALTGGDDPWHFGASDQYPVLQVDFNGDGVKSWQEFGPHSRRVAVSPGVLSLMEGEAGTYTVVLLTTPTDSVTVTPMSDNPAVSVSGELTFSMQDWNVEQTVAVRAVNDDNGVDEVVSLTHTVESEDLNYALVTIPVVTVNVADPGTDYDADDDNLIEVRSLEQLNAIRYDLDGDGDVTQFNMSNYADAFPYPATSMGCLATCKGYELMADLDFDTSGDDEITTADGVLSWGSGLGWEPIGTSFNRFTAEFHGNGHTISHLFINRPDTDNVGLFGYVDNGAVIRSVGLVGVDVTGDDNVGGLVGSNGFGGTINASYATGEVRGNGSVGGLVGSNDGTINASYATGVVRGDDRIGGLVGLSNGTIRASYATGEVRGDDVVGGLVGTNDDDGTIRASYATGVVIGDNIVGGLAGLNSGGTINASYTTGEVRGDSNVGGLVGRNYFGGPIIDSYFDTDTSGLTSFRGRTTAALRSPTTYTGIYANWNVDLDDADSDSNALTGGDDPWHFGASDQYPVLQVDFNGDGVKSWQEFGPQSPQSRPGVFVSPRVLSLMEGEAGTYTVVLLTTPTNSVTVTPMSDNPAVSVSGELTFSMQDWNVEQTVAVRAVNDDNNVNEVVSLTHTVESEDPNYALVTTPVVTVNVADPGTDYDADNDNLIEVRSLEQLNAIRYDLDGDGDVTQSNMSNYADAFPYPATSMGCLATCKGYELTADLDFDTSGDDEITTADGVLSWGSGLGWEPIGTAANFFTAEFHGNDHTISHLFINRASTIVSGIGLFGYVGSRAVIRSVGLVGVDVTGENSVGGLVGWSSGTIRASYATGEVNGGGGIFSAVGGLVGLNSSGTIRASYATGEVRGDHTVGGLVGRNSGGTIEASYATGVVNGGSSSRNVGGLVGRNGGGTINASYATGVVNGGSSSRNVGGLVGWSSGTIRASYATSEVRGDDQIGGLVGTNDGGTIRASYATGEVRGDHTVGGLVGRNSGGTIEASYATGVVNGGSSSRNVGGLVGANSGGTINASYATGVVNGGSSSRYVGGLVGLNSRGLIRASYATGEVRGDDRIGGLVGWNSDGTIRASYATGEVNGGGNVGGLVGWNSSGGTIRASYATGEVSGTGNVGGLVGWNSGGTIEASYATGVVNGGGIFSSVGGLVGLNRSGTIIDSYFDTDTSGLTGSEGRATDELQSPTTYTGIYANWNVDLDDADSDSNALTGGDDPWHFGASDQYPVLQVDFNGDGVKSWQEFGPQSQSRPGVAVSPRVLSLMEGEAGTYTVVLLTTPTDSVTVTPMSDNPAVSVSGELTFSMQDWNVEQTVVVRAVNDDNNVNEVVSLTHTVESEDLNYALVTTPVVTVNVADPGTDYDADNDNLIEVRSLEQLNAIRYDLDGDGDVTQSNISNYADAFPYPATSMGCLATCKGYELTADLDFDTSGDDEITTADGVLSWGSGSGWQPIGTSVNRSLTAEFHGNGHTISHLFINRPGADYVGLFGYVGSGAVIRSVGLVGVDVTGRADAGGLVGFNSGGTINASYATGEVRGGSTVGGLVGDNRGTINASYATGEVSGQNTVGGLVGFNAGTGTIRASYATGEVNGGGNVGGLVGWNSSGGTIRASYATGEVSGTGNVGGLVGGSNGTIRASYATGEVRGDDRIGGLVGWNSDGTIRASYATGEVRGDDLVGGLVGWNSDGTIRASYATGVVNSGGSFSDVGGLVGINRGTIRASYATGVVNGGSFSDVGGLVGSNTGMVIDSYFDTDTSGLTGSEGRATDELQSPTTYTGIYANWNVDLDDADSDSNALTGGDDPWHFGASEQYPVLQVDFNGDGVKSWQEFGPHSRIVAVSSSDVTAVLSPVGADTLSVSAGGTAMLTVTTDPMLRDGETATLILSVSGGADVSLNPAQVTLSGATRQVQVAVVAGLQAAQLAEDVAVTVAVTAAADASGVNVNLGAGLPLEVVPLSVEVTFAETGIELIAGERRTIGFEVSPADRGISQISVAFEENDASGGITVASPVTVDNGETTGNVTVTVGGGVLPGLSAQVTVDGEETDAGRAQVSGTNSLRVTVVRNVGVMLDPAGLLSVPTGRSTMLTVTTDPALRAGESAMLTLSVGDAVGVSLSSTQVVLRGADATSVQVELIAELGAAVGTTGEVSVTVAANSGVRVNAEVNPPFSVAQLQLEVSFSREQVNLAMAPRTVEVEVQPALVHGAEKITVGLDVEREPGSTGIITVSPSTVVLSATQSATEVAITMTDVEVGESATITLTIDDVGTDVGGAQTSVAGDLRVNVVGRDVAVVFLDDVSLAQITTLTLSANELTTVRVSTTPTLNMGETATLDLEVPGDSGLSVIPAPVMLNSGTANEQVMLSAARLAGGTVNVSALERLAAEVAVLRGRLEVTVVPMVFTVTLAGAGGDLVSGRSTTARLSVSPALMNEETITVGFAATREIGAIDPVTLGAAGRSSATITVTANDGVAADAPFMVTPQIDSDRSNIGNADVAATGSLQGTVRRLFIVSFSQETLMLTHRQASSPVAVGTGESPLLTSGEEITVTLTSSGSVTVLPGSVTLTQGVQSTTVTIRVPPDLENEGNVGGIILSVESTGVNHVFVESNDQPLRVFFEPNRGIMLRIRVFLEGALQ